MLSKNDFLEFCNQLMVLEVEMERGAIELSKLVKDKKATEMLTRIAEAEQRHEKLILEIENIIKKHYV